MIVINFWGGPGAGKSATAAGLFYLMKVNGLRCELVTEYAKELVYERRSLEDQFYILAQQNRRLERLRDSVDWVITDSPLPLSLVFANETYGEWFKIAVKALFSRYNNFNVRIRRAQPYQEYGRVHSEEQSLALDDHITQVLTDLSVGWFTVDANPSAPQKIYETLVRNR